MNIFVTHCTNSADETQMAKKKNKSFVRRDFVFAPRTMLMRVESR